ncbi:MAG: NAD(P)-dependent alcohol dehydrogenase [Lewinella sp.]
MKAIICNSYGPPERLRIADLPIPAPGPGEVLVRVHHATLNDYDWSLVRGRPYPYRLLFGLRRPKFPIPGIELSGTVVGVGPNVGRFGVGAPVFGDISGSGWGSLAEYVVVKAKDIVARPPDIPSEVAVTLPHAGMLAWQALFDAGRLMEGEQVLINGGGGGVGTLALQLAKTKGARVTGVDTGPKLERMTEMGFDDVIDYRRQDFTRPGGKYDLIVDTKTTRPATAYARVLRPGGRYVTVGGTLSRLIGLLLHKPFLSQPMKIVSLKPNRDMDALIPLVREKKVVPLIDGPHPLTEVPHLLRYFGEGKHQGKIVIQISTP